MKRLRVISVIFAVAFIISAFAFGATKKANVPEFQKSQAIINLRGVAAQNLIGKEVTLDGFYYDGSIPMIVDDIQRVSIDMVMPPDSYVPIVGPPPKGVKSGDRISLKGVKLDKPSGSDPVSVRSESTVLRLSATAASTILQPSTSKFSMLERFPYLVNPPALLRPQYYAVLIAGGWDYANNHQRYWNDLKTMYTILLNAGYPQTNIYVIYADGVARDTSMPVYRSATTTNIAQLFSFLASKMTAKDTLYTMLNDHGSPDALCLWNQTTISATAFAAEVNKIANYDKMIIQMKQCYSGGFIQPLTAPRRTVMSSCSATEVSHGNLANQFGEFTYWYFAALTGKKPDNSGPVNADTNGDGKISILEAYNFARSHDAAPETPYFEDDGIAPGHMGPMPASGDGIRSTVIFLF